MSFERQICRKCKRVCFCVDVRSLDTRKFHFKHPFWICEYDLAEFLAPITKGLNEIEQIMIKCGIEDIERVSVQVKTLQN